MPNPEGPTEPGPPSDPSGPTQPIRPTQGREPIPERVRQPIVVPRPVSTIAGLPRAFAVAAVVALVVALAGGFLIGRSVGDGEPSEEGAAARGGRCGKALSLSLELIELQNLAVANRTQLAQAVALADEGQVAELTSAFEQLAPALQDAQAEMEAALEKCRNRRSGGGKRDRGGGGNGGKGNA